MSTNLIFVICGVVAFILLVTVVLILTRYKKCKSNELLIVYGKTKGNTACKCYHGGSAFVWPVIQGYSIISMDPIKIICNMKNVLSSQKIEVDIDSVITVAVSTKEETMRNAAVRLLGLNENEKIDQVKDVLFGQLRLIVAEMNIESLISNRTEFLQKCNDNISEELKKFGLDLVNINISDIKDHAEYIDNLGKEMASKARYEALAKIEQRTKEGEVEVAKQKKEKQIQLSEITRDQEIEVSENKKQQDIKTAEIERDRVTTTETTKKEQEVSLRDIEREKRVQIAEKAKDEAVSIREVEKNQTLETASLEREEAEKKSEIERDKQIAIATNKSEQDQKVAEQQRLRDAEVAKQSAEAATAVAQANATKDAEVVKATSESKAKQAEAEQKSEADIVEAQQNSEARKETARQEADSKKVKAQREKESQVAEYAAETRKRQANAEKNATITENTAGIEVAKSNAQLGKEQAESEKIIGESKAQAAQAVGIAEAEKDEQVALAKGKAEKAKQEATIMVGTEIEADRKRAEAKGKKDATITEAEGTAAAIRLVAEAEADKIRLTKIAEADGAKQMAEAKKVEMQAETENLANLARADVGDATMISYVLKDQWIGMVEAEMKKFEHINLGTVTVVGGSDKAADFMGNIAKVVQGASGLGSENVPGIMGVIGKLMNFDKKNQIQQPTEEPEQPQEETPKESK